MDCLLFLTLHNITQLFITL